MSKINFPSQEEDRKEREKLFLSGGNLLLCFSNLEFALSELFSHIILSPRIISNSVYFSIKSIDGRLETIDDVLSVRCGITSVYNESIKEIWEKLKTQIRKRKDIRNSVAHGQITMNSP